MTCTIENQGCFSEGSTSYHDYSFTDKNGDPIETAEAIRYKLSDGVEILKDWEAIEPPTAPGEIEIDGALNIIDGSCKRFLTIEATHDGGKKIQKTIMYELTNSINI